MKSLGIKALGLLVITAILLVIGACSRNVPPHDEDIVYNHSDPTPDDDIAYDHDEPLPNDTTTYTPNQPAHNANVTYALERANERRRQIEGLYYGDLRQLSYGRAEIEANVHNEIIEHFGQYAWDWVRQFQYPVELPYTLTQQQALHDLQILRLLMQRYYGAYLYYGGDDVFLPLFATMEHIVIEHSGFITPYNLILLIHSHLSQVIVDNHFFVHHLILSRWGHESGFGTSAGFFITDLTFNRSEFGFYNRELDLYVREVQGHDMDSLFRLSINQNGDLFYTPVVYLLDHAGMHDYTLFVTHACGDEGEIVLRRMPFSDFVPAQNDVTRSQISTDLLNDIPIVQISRMGWPVYESDFQRLIEYAYDLRYEPVVIIDIRSNQGGNTELPVRFMRALTGQDVNMHTMMFQYNTFFGSMRGTAEAVGESLFFPTRALDYYSFVKNFVGGNLVPNVRLFIILIDGYTVSAGEVMVDVALNMENTLVIGQNTRGMLHKSGGLHFHLPYSGIHFWFGAAILFKPDGLFQEGVGFAPDIWVYGDALEAALAFIGQR